MHVLLRPAVGGVTHESAPGVDSKSMDINDYLIPQAGKDWHELLSGWLEVLPKSFTLWMVNRFGDLFVVLDGDAVHMLDVGVGSFKRVANNRSHFAELIDVGDNATNWLMIPLVNACVASGMTLKSNECYGFKIPPVLGGEYRLSNVAPIDMSVHYSFLADIHRQTKHLPDGTPITMVTADRGGQKK